MGSVLHGILLAGDGLLQLLYLVIVFFYARFQTGNNIFQVIHLERELTANGFDAVDLGIYGLELKKGGEFFLHGDIALIGSSCFSFSHLRNNLSGWY